MNYSRNAKRGSLKNRGPKSFQKEYFPGLMKLPVLYSDTALVPNTPVNVILGALILKEYTGMSDEDIMNTLMFDIRYHYALHTTSFIEQPLSDRSLGRFRQRCILYERQTGIDLNHDTITGLSEEMVAMMGC